MPGKRIGDLYVELWSEMIRRYDGIFVFYRMGDDLGYKNSTLPEPATILKHILVKEIWRREDVC